MKLAKTDGPDNSLAHVSENSGFLSKLLSGAEYCHPVTFRKVTDTGGWEEVSLWMRLLTVRENLEVDDLVTAELGEDLTNANVLKRAIRTMQLTLAKACTVQEKEQKVGLEEFLDIPDTHLTQLNSIYTDLCAKYDPSFEEDYTQETIEAIVSKLEKKSLPLNALSRYELVMVAKYLISERTELQDNIRILSSLSPSS